MFFVQFYIRMILFVKVIWTFSTLFYKETAQIQIAFFSCHFVETHQCHLCDLMSRIAFALAFFRSKIVINIVCKTHGGFQQFVLAGCLIIGHRTLCQVSEAVQFVVVTEIGENLIFSVDDVIGVQVSVFLLGCADDINGLICQFFQFRIRVLGQGVRHRLDPFIEIAVLEYKTVKFIFQMIRVLRQSLKPTECVLWFFKGTSFFFTLLVLLSCHLEIPHAKTWAGPLDTVIQRIPLIRNDLLAD